MKDKKGGDKIISVYWFVILFLVTGAIIYMISSSYSPYDVRKIEADIMINKIADCLSQDRKLNLNINQENFGQQCRINFDSEFEGQGEYYVEVNFTDFKTEEPLYFDNEIKYGNVNLKESLKVVSKSNSFTHSFKSFYVLNEDESKEVIVNIISIVRKTEKNVK